MKITKAQSQVSLLSKERKEHYNLVPVLLASNMTTVTNSTSSSSSFSTSSSSIFDPGRADAYFDNNQLKECELYLKDYYPAKTKPEGHTNTNNQEKKEDPEVLWRYARLWHRQTESVPPNEREHLIRRSLACIEEALDVLLLATEEGAARPATEEEAATNKMADDIGHNSQQSYASYASCYKWKALLIGELGNYVPLKEKIANAFVIKDLFLQSLDMQQKSRRTENSPDDDGRGQDPVVLFGMGEWCARVAATGYLQRKLAATLFAVPPESSYDDACQWYRQAIQEKPDFKRCYYCLGDALWAMGHKEQARSEGYRPCLAIPSSRPFEYELDTLAKKRL